MNIRRLLLWIIRLILTVIFIIATFLIIALIQEKLLLPKDYIMWIFKYPISRLTIVFVFEFVFAFLGLGHLVKRNKKWFYPIFVFTNLLLIYILLVNVCVITNDKIVNRSFLSPQGRVYSYSDIVSINTGIYEEKILNIPFTDKSGEFYYIITLKDGTKIDLNGDAGGTQNDQSIYEIFEEIDKTLVAMDIKKTAKIDDFQLLEEDLDKIYFDRIRNILENVK